MEIIKDITLDLNSGLKDGISRNFVEVYRGEVDSRVIRARITKDKKTFPIPNTFSAKVDISLNGVLVAEDMPCKINPNKGESSMVYIPITECMCSEVGLGVGNLKFIEDNSKVIVQKFYILVVDNVNGKSRSIYSEIEKVNEVLSQTIRDDMEPVYLDEERLNQLPEVLDETKDVLFEMGIDFSDLYLNDIPNVLRAIIGRYGCKLVSINSKDDGDDSLSKLVDDNYIGVYTLGGNTNSYLFYNIYTPDYNLNEQFRLIFNQKENNFTFDAQKRVCRVNGNGQRVWTTWDTYKQGYNTVWEGKTAVFFGDSLTEENYHYTKGYHKWVQEILGFASYCNYGKSGWGYADIYNKVDAVADPADIVFVGAGVNEQTYHVPIGTISDSTTDTTYGRLNLLCARLKEKYPTSVILFMTPHYQTKYPHNNGITSYEVGKAVKEVCEKFAIPVYDNFIYSGICDSNLSVFTTDNCHWNDIAHEMVGKNLAQFVANRFRYCHGYTPKNRWIGKTVTVEKNSSADKDANLTCLIAVDEDIKKGAVLKLKLKGIDCNNVLALTSAYGGFVHGDTSGAVNNGSYSGTLAARQNSQITLDKSGTMEFICGDVIINKDVTTPYIKVGFVLFGDEPYSFKITEISVSVNGKEKPILDIGAFFKPEKEIIKYAPKSEWIGKTVTCELGDADDNSCHLVALVAVDDDMKTGATITRELRAVECVNMSTQTITGGNCYGDNSGAVSNASWTKNCGKSSNHTQIVSNGVATWDIGVQTVNRDLTESYIKVPIIIGGNSFPFSFKIEDISVKVNGKEKTILALGSFFASDKEIIKIE